MKKSFNFFAKAIQATRLNFEMDFEELLHRARSGRFNRVQWATAVRAILKRYGRQAYLDGLIDGGIMDGVLDEEDEAEIKRLTIEQSQYVTGFGDVLFKAITDAQARQKPAMWFNKSIMPFYNAGRLSANKNGYFLWVMGRTEKHCSDCSRLSGQVHRLRDWRKQGWLPQSSKLECKGFRCDCKLIPVSAGRGKGKY